MKGKIKIVDFILPLCIIDTVMHIEANQIEVIDDKTAEILRQKTPAERLSIGFSLWHSTNQLLPSLIKSLHPEWSNAKISREVIKRLSHGTI